ncbi:hypothetical protein [Bartonella sp. cb54]|uniref:hypothetical protein n=1 Tax=Bartonella sp. cb54 TaxID=3385560 RepID=UPI0039A5F33C
MTYVMPFSNPLFSGFETAKKTLQHIDKTNGVHLDYNIERLQKIDNINRICITLAASGFKVNNLGVFLNDTQLIIYSKKLDRKNYRYFYHAIATTSFFT